jgi:hypothetical protein
MREHAEFRRVKRILLLGIFRCNYKFASVNGGTRRFEVGLIRYIVKKSGPACQVPRMGIGGVASGWWLEGEKPLARTECPTRSLCGPYPEAYRVWPWVPRRKNWSSGALEQPLVQGAERIPPKQPDHGTDGEVGTKRDF